MEKKTSVMHSFNGTGNSKFFSTLLLGVILTAALGLGSGFILSQVFPDFAQKGVQTALDDKDSITVGQSYGSNDTKTFKDQVEGTLKDGGIEGEGQYHLERPGGESQNVYLTSSLVDLSLFINHKVKVWGETQSAQKAGWLMDVGRVEVLN